MEPSQPPDNPNQFGRYTLLRPLATGGMGEVFLAKHEGVAGFQKKVVIKKILPHLANDDNFVRRFIDEARLVVSLSHSNIVQVFDMGKEEGAYFIAMEYVDGVDLRILLKKNRALGKELPLPLALYVLAEVSAGLDYAHTREDEHGQNLRIVHRDISPSNVMLSKDGAVKLVDFGVAKSASRLNHSLSGSLRGKVRYMSPEQANGETLGSPSDVFSLGVMGYELLTGKRLFDGDTDLKTLDQVRHGRIPTVTAEHPHLPTPVALLIEACLSRNPGERPSADNVRRDLLGQLHELTLGEGITSQDLGKYVKEALGDDPDGMNLSDALDLQLGNPSSDAGQTATFLRDAEEWKPSSPSDVFERSSSWPSTEITAQQTANVKSLTSMVRILVAAVVILLVVNVIFFFGSGDRTNSPPVEPAPPDSSNAAPSPENGITQEAPVKEPPKPTEQPTAVEPIPIVDTVKPSSPAAEGEDRRQQIEEPEREKRVGMDEVLKFKTVKLTPSPSTAKVFANGTLLGTGPQEVKFKEDAEMKVWVKEKGYKTSYTTLSATSRSRVTVTLSPEGAGTVRFRFFPANAKVFLNGKEEQLGGTNVVEKKMSIGEHTVEIVGRNGERKTKRTFVIKADQVQQLGTIKL